jgi:hypothetical protein
MNNSFSNASIVRGEPERMTTPLHILVFLSVSAAAVLGGVTLIFGGQGLQFQLYLALLCLFATASAIFVTSRIRNGKVQMFALPVFITCLMFINFGLAPLRNLIDPSQMESHLAADGRDLVLALSYCILGMVAFWMGCQAALPKRDQMSTSPSEDAPVPEVRQRSVFISVVGLYVLGTAAKYYMLTNRLYSYTASMERYSADLSSMQFLNIAAQCASYALMAAAVERYHKRSDPAWKAVFWVFLLLEVFWGAISGAKSVLFQNFMAVALVSSLVQRKVSLRWLAALLFGLVLFYPVSDAYRTILRGRQHLDVASFSDAARSGRMALADAAQNNAGEGGLWQAGLVRTIRRFDMLTSVADILALGPRADIMKKPDVHWWMLPIYPFVPRFIWRSKPILDEGGWFTAALRGNSGTAGTVGTSTAVTYLGDLYIQFGLLGIPAGMFLLGFVAQWFTNPISGPLDRKSTFVYSGIFLFGFWLESDVFLVWAAFIRLLVIVYLLSWLIYGPRHPLTRNSKTENRKWKPEAGK